MDTRKKGEAARATRYSAADCLWRGGRPSHPQMWFAADRAQAQGRRRQLGRFILGAMFGGVVVIGGLVVGSALFPPTPANAPVQAEADAPEVTAPEAVEPVAEADP